jgi:L-lysine exporter family protein LysE/ArgO
MLNAINHGLLLALGLILPLGVQNMFVFNQGMLQKRFINTFLIVITVSLCDTFLILLAVSGLSFIFHTFIWIKNILLGLGIFFLVYIGYLNWCYAPKSNINHHDIKLPVFRLVGYATLISLVNPHAIIDTIGVIGISSLNYSGIEKIYFTISCIFVSWVWFFILAITGRTVRQFDQSTRIVYFTNKFAAFIMWGSAIYLIYLLTR